METAVHQNYPQWLAQWLYQELQTAGQHLSLQVRCVLKQHILLILTQHPPAIEPDSEQLLRTLTQALQSLPSDTLEQWIGHSAPLPVRLYLRVIGQPQPYRVQDFTWLPPDPVIPPTAASLPVITPAPAPDPMVELAEALLPVAETAMPEMAIAPTSINLPQPLSILTRLANLPIFDPIPTSLWAACAICGLLTLGGGLYLLSRPCVVGNCPPLETAQRLSQESAQMAQPTASPREVIDAYYHLTEASYLLNTIPPWSPYYESAQTLLRTYEARAMVFEEVVTALQTAQVAAAKSQYPPHPLSVWREVQQTWRQAIAPLQKVPSDSPIYLLAQRKLREYEMNLTTIDRRIRVEQEAQAQVNAARSVATVAEARAASTRSVASWQVIVSTWQVAVNTLQTVPQGTMVYAEARQLLAIYQPKLATARDRHTQESTAAAAYHQALDWAQQARRSAQQQQWSQSVQQWQAALAATNRVANGTLFYPQVQPLIAPYKSALASAQTALQKAVVYQQVESILQATCMGSTPICTFTIEPNAIQIRLTNAYDWAIQSVVANRPLVRDPNTQTALQTYINGLLRSFGDAGQKAELPLDLYNSEGRLFSSYDPRFQGYVLR